MNFAPTRLENFYFDMTKSGRILSEWMESCNKSKVQIAEEVGMSVDVVKNFSLGRVKELHIDRIFKIAVATGHSISEYIALMLDGENIAFADAVIVPEVEKPLSKIHHIQPVDDVIVKQMEGRCGSCAQQHKETMQIVKDYAERSRKDIEDALNKRIEDKSETIRRLRKRNTIIVSMLVVETIILVLFAIFDLPYHTAGAASAFTLFSQVRGVTPWRVIG